MFPFTTSHSLKQGFTSGLAAMLEQHHGLGTYILVLANAAYDPDLWSQLASALKARHTQLANALTQALRNGNTLREPEDDVMVFLKLMAMGFDNIQTVQTRRAGSWNLFYNPIRALRPPRLSGLKFDKLLRPFNATGFHFNKPFLAKEILWQGELNGKPARLLYNKFPFAHLHGLLVPEPDKQWPQYLSPELHDWAWEICSASTIPGFCLAYNSTGAGASVNHLHFQSFVQATPLPVQRTEFKHNGGNIAYPLGCYAFGNPDSAWLKIAECHQSNTPYNLIYSAGQIQVIPRAAQGSASLSALSQGWGWSELAGVITLFGRDEFDGFDASRIETELAKLMP